MGNKGQTIEAPQVPTFSEGSDDDKPKPPGGLTPPEGIGQDVEGYRSNPYSFDSSQGRGLKVEEMDYGQLCSDIAGVAKGMSGREIAKLGVAWQAAGYASEEGVITRAMIMEKVQDALKSH